MHVRNEMFEINDDFTSLIGLQELTKYLNSEHDIKLD